MLAFGAAVLAFASPDCSQLLDGKPVVFADMSDGDEKLVTLSGATMQIDPYGNAQNWTISAPLSKTDCSAMVNFSVKGKPNPPPVPLKASIGTFAYGPSGVEGAKIRATILFTDPSGTMAEPDYPLDAWVAAYTS